MPPLMNTNFYRLASLKGILNQRVVHNPVLLCTEKEYLAYEYKQLAQQDFDTPIFF